MHGNKLLFEYCIKKEDTVSNGDTGHEKNIRVFAGVEPPPKAEVAAGAGAGATDSAVAC